MESLFVTVLKMSFTASILALVVVFLRFVLKKAPRALITVMWALVAIRLVCPITPESDFSLLPEVEPIAQEITENVSSAIVESDTLDTTKPFTEREDVPLLSESTEVVTPDVIPVEGEVVQNVPSVEKMPPSVSEIENNEDTETDGQWLYKLIPVAAKIWLAGMLGMLVYSIFSYIRIYRKVRESAPLADDKTVRICDGIDTPFILGILRPRIYLPSTLQESDLTYVLAHEQAHLKRLDHIWKPFGFLLLSVYWFNPVLWLAYILLCRDIELACDEKVLKELGVECKKSYSAALINCSVPRKWIAACPLAFGEVGVKGRIKSILHYKKPAFWLILAAIAACIWLTVSFLTNPKGKEEKTPKKEISVVVGNEYAAYLDAEGKLHIVYDEAGVTEGVDFDKTYKGLGADPYRLVTMDEDGKLWASYPYTADEVQQQIDQLFEEISLAGGNMGSSHRDPEMMRAFAKLADVRQIVCNYPYDYVALLEDGTLVDDVGTVYESLCGVTSFTEDCNGVKLGLMEDGTLVIPEMGDLLRKKKLNEWPEKLAQLCAGSYFVGLLEDGTVLAEDTELNYLINEIEHWSGITKIAAARGTVVGIKEDGTVVAVCTYRSDKGQCAVEDWTDIVAIGTNGSVTVGVKADGSVVITKDVEESEADANETDSKNIAENMPTGHDYENVKEVFLEYLNHQAWLYPTEYPQEEYYCHYEVYRSEKLAIGQLWLRCFTDHETKWYACIPTKYNNIANQLYIAEDDHVIPDETMYCIGEDYVFVPKATKPEYTESTEKENAIASIQKNVEGIYQDLRENGYEGALKLEVLVSEFSESLAPYAYVIVNDESVFETKFSLSNGLYQEYVAQNYSALSTEVHPGGTGGYTKEYDGRGILPLSTIDETQWARVKDCAVLHVTYTGPDTTQTAVASSWSETVAMRHAKVGNIVTFGYYEQDNDLFNGQEPIEWLVLEVTDGKALLLSKYGLDVKAYHGTDDAVTWETSGLRNWLNSTFYNVAFGENEKILTTTIMNDDNEQYGTDGGALTEDRVFLLSLREKEKYFPETWDGFRYNSKDSITVPTPYAIAQGAWYDDEYQGCWLLRSPGRLSNMGTWVNNSGAVSDGVSVVGEGMVRPAIWIDLNKIEQSESKEPDDSTKPTVTLTIDGETVSFPEEEVTISVSKELGVGIAFVHQYTFSHTAHYNIYRSEDGGKNWFLVAEDYTATAGDIASVLIPERNTVVCYFALSGVTVQSNIEISKDGGATWTPQVQLLKPNDDLKDPEIGCSVLFGSYEQDGNLANGKEKLEWFVLDKRDGKALLLSKYGLETMPYHDADVEVTWENCSLRSWLNEEFYRTAFTTTERAWIAETLNETPDNSYNGTEGGNTTKDFVFLLSMEEVLLGKRVDEKPYFRDDVARVTVPTAYAAVQGAWLDENGDWFGENATWWLRTPGATVYRTVKVNREGSISVVGTENNVTNVVVRPAIWIDLEFVEQ